MIDISMARDFASREGWLSQTPVALRKTILDKTLFKTFETGETIYGVGDPEGGIYCLIRGGLRVTIAPGKQGPHLAHLFRPGTWIGEGPLIRGKPRLIGISAAGPTDVLYLPLHPLNEILRKDPAVWRYISLLTLGNSEIALGVVSDLMIRDHIQRLVAVILRLAGGLASMPDGSREIEIDVSQDDLAAMANVARTTANTTLKKLQSAGLVDITYRRIKIVAPDKLRAMLVD